MKKQKFNSIPEGRISGNYTDEKFIEKMIGKYLKLIKDMIFRLKKKNYSSTWRVVEKKIALGNHFNN